MQGGTSAVEALDRFLTEVGCGEAGAKALCQVVNDVVSERMEEMWQKGRNMMSQLQKEQTERVSKLTDELAACRAQCDELHSMVRHLIEKGRGNDGDDFHVATAACVDNGSTASGTSSPESPEVKDGSELSSPESTGVCAGSAEVSQPLAAAAPKMPAFLQLGPALPVVMPFPFAAPQPFVAPSPPTPLQQPQSEQRLLSLAEALADTLPAVPSPPNAAAGPGAEPMVASMSAAASSTTATSSQPELFTLTLQKAGSSLGLNVSHNEKERVLHIEGIFPGSAAESWNRGCAVSGGKPIEVGDRIISINHVSYEPEQMLQECRDGDVLTLTLLRVAGACCGKQSPSAASPAKASTILRADASVFVPMSGCNAGKATDSVDTKESK